MLIYHKPYISKEIDGKGDGNSCVCTTCQFE